MWKIQKNAQKTLLFSAAIWNTFLAWITLKFGFLYFWQNCRKLNFLSKNINSESIGILSSKLWPKYETDLQFFFKISNGNQHEICSSLSNRLIPSLSFRINFFWKINWIEKQIHIVKIFKNAQKTLLLLAAIWNAFFAWKMLKFGFLYFWKSCR